MMIMMMMTMMTMTVSRKHLMKPNYKSILVWIDTLGLQMYTQGGGHWGVSNTVIP